MQSRTPTNIDIAVLALAHLDGAFEKVHHERVAVKAYELAPDKFGWTLLEFRQRNWPDKEAVRSALEDAKKEKHGGLVDGGYNKDPSKDGWRLTAAGAKWIVEHEQRITSGLSSGPAAIPKKEAQRFCKQLRSAPLFKAFADAGNLDTASRYEFTDLLECSPDAARDTIRKKFDRLCTMAHLVDDRRILEFLDLCAVKFASLVTEVI
jgi:hypothetical protein